MLDFDHEETYLLLVRVCRRFAVDPSSSLESEEFFRRLLQQYVGNSDESSIIAWLENEMPKLFVALGQRPQWIQSSEWPIVNGEPLIFAGQIDIPVNNIANLFHDDTSVYVFLGKQSPPIVIIQQY